MKITRDNRVMVARAVGAMRDDSGPSVGDCARAAVQHVVEEAWWEEDTGSVGADWEELVENLAELVLAAADGGYVHGQEEGIIEVVSAVRAELFEGSEYVRGLLDELGGRCEAMAADREEFEKSIREVMEAGSGEVESDDYMAFVDECRGEGGEYDDEFYANRGVRGGG